jgi:Rrf2 family protein
MTYLCSLTIPMFSKACEYAIRAMLFIAQSGPGYKIGIKEISKGIDAPEHFLAKILQDLSRKGMVQSIKGPNGGFYVDSMDKKRTLADIVRAVDGDSLFTGCGLGLKICSEKNPCPLHDEFKIIRKKILSMLETATIAEFNDELLRGLKHLKR